LVLVAQSVAIEVRTAIGPGRQRGRVMLAGGLGGLTLGVISAPFLTEQFGADVSAILAVIGIIVGWATAWVFAYPIAKEPGA
jgi:Zn-dependent protease